METSRKIILKVSNLSKKFGNLHVLNKIDFDVYDGEFVAILGPSGCGKTTLLRTITGIIQYDEGNVLLDGRPIAERNECEIGMVFQEPRLLPWRTTYNNVRLPFELLGRTENTHEAVKNSLELVGLTDFSQSYPHELSGGMRSRVSLARALAPDPRLLIMDEPLTGLDVRTRNELQEEILRIWNKKRKSLILVTHDPEEAVYLANRIIVLSNRPTSIKAVLSVDLPHPRDRHDAEIVGISNRIRKLFE